MMIFIKLSEIIVFIESNIFLTIFSFIFYFFKKINTYLEIGDLISQKNFC